jgi:hypothetical protein
VAALSAPAPPPEEVILDLADYAKCGNCLRCQEHHPSDPFEVVNLATGIRHIGADFGMTLCGHDTAGTTYTNWWWKL